MPMPSGIRAIDLMMGIPSDDISQWYEFREEVWPMFLRENAIRVFKLDE